MNDLVEYLLNLVHNPAQAEEFRANSDAKIASSYLSDDDKAQLAEMVANTPAPEQPVIQSGRFYVGDDHGHNVKVVSSATQDIMADVDPAERKAHRVKVADTKGEWPHPNRMILKPIGNSEVYLDHILLDDGVGRLKAKITALTIEVEDDQTGDDA